VYKKLWTKYFTLNISINNADRLAERLCSDNAVTAAVLFSVEFPAAPVFVFGRLTVGVDVFVDESTSTADDAV